MKEDRLAKAAASLGFTLSEGERAAFPALIEEILSNIGDLSMPAVTDSPVRKWRRAGYNEDPLNAFAALTFIQTRDEGSLAGVRVALKDNIALAGVPMGNGASVLEDFIPREDAVVVERLLSAGAIIVGKTNCECLCASGASFTGANGPVLNPWDVTRSAGGSSSGAAVAVASGQADLAVGGDQGGSIRTPSALCGIVGLKPTFGRVPYTGIASVDASLDHAGPMALTTLDTARMLSVIAGPDLSDPRSRSNLPMDDWEAAALSPAAGLRIGVLAQGFSAERADPTVADLVRDAIGRLAPMTSVSSVDVPAHDHAVAAWLPVILYGTLTTLLTDGAGYGLTRDAMADMAGHLKGWQRRSGELSDVLRVLLLAAEQGRQQFGFSPYLHGHRLGRSLANAYDAALSDFDVLAMPTLPKVAGKLPVPGDTVAQRFAAAVETSGNVSPFNLTGHPAITVPVGLVDGLPVGLMFVSRHGNEAALFRAAAAVERLALMPATRAPRRVELAAV